MIELDLRRNGMLSISDAKKITELEPIVRNSYNHFVGELAKKNSLYEEQWLLRVTCRNTYLSLIHDRFCRLALLEDKLNSGEQLGIIKLDSFSMEEPVKQLLSQAGCNAAITIDGYRIVEIIKMKSCLLLNILKNIYFCLNSWFWIKFFPRMNVTNKDIVLLDSFLVGDHDRYYTGLLENVSVETKETIYYLPTLFGIRYPWEWLSKFRRVHGSDENILLKESWLKFSDYLLSIYKSIFLANSIKIIPSWRGVNVFSIVKEELSLDKGSFFITNSLLIIISFKRYKEAGIKVKGVVDWFENQVIDRALSLGVKKYYPTVTIKGYMGFVAGEYYAGLTPMLYESKNKVLPDEILLVGSYFREKMKKSCPWLKISIGPAFRFQSIIDFKQDERISKSTILLAMPMLLNESKRIIKLASSIKLNSQYVWKIKVHPTISEERFKKMVPESCDKKFVFVNETLSNVLQETKLLVTVESSAALEAVGCGVPVAIIGSRSGPTINPLLGVVSDSYWSVCYRSEELLDAITRDFSVEKLDLSNYLEPVTKKGVMEMMHWS